MGMIVCLSDAETQSPDSTSMIGDEILGNLAGNKESNKQKVKGGNATHHKSYLVVK